VSKERVGGEKTKGGAAGTDEAGERAGEKKLRKEEQRQKRDEGGGAGTNEMKRRVKEDEEV
jgi:hypothetical protein